LRSSRLHNLAHEILDAPSLMTRFPAFRLPSDFVGVFQPDGGFVQASPCSGHGFKFAPVIGEILADLAVVGRTDRDISRFSLARFS